MATSTKEERGWNLYQRKDGQWVLQWKRAPGDWPEHRVPREHRTERQAERYSILYLDELRKQLATRPTPPPAPTGGSTVRSLAEGWEKLCSKNPKLSPATRKQHKDAIEVHVLHYPEVADVPIVDLGPATLRRWVRQIRDEGKVTPKWEKVDGRKVRTRVYGGALAPNSVGNIVNSLSAFFDDAMAEEWIELPANPVKHVAVRREVPERITRAGKHTIIHLTRAAAAKVITCEKVPEWRRVRMLLALTSGMAEGELSGIKLDDLALDAEIPTVKITKALALEGDDGFATQRAPKTDNRVRVLPLHPAAVRALKGWKSTGWTAFVGHKPGGHEPVFPNSAGEAWRPDSAALLREDLLAADLPSTYEGHNFTAHATRRSFATWLTEARVSADTIKRLMGHAAAGVTAQHYAAQDLELLRDAVATIVLDLTTAQVIALPVKAVAG
jgi:integrase